MERRSAGGIAGQGARSKVSQEGETKPLDGQARSSRSRAGLPELWRDRNGPHWKRIVYIGVAIFVVGYSTYAVARYHTFHGSVDHADVCQLLWNAGHGNGMRGSVEAFAAGMNEAPMEVFHVRPVFYPLAAVYRLFPYPPSAPILQILAIGFAAIPLFALGCRTLGCSRSASLLAAGYLLYPSWTFAAPDFHLETITPLFFFASLLLFEKNRSAAGFAAAIGVVLLKEVGALAVMGMGLYLIAARRHYRWGVLLILAAAFYFYIATYMVTPTASGNPYRYIARYSRLGGSLGEVMLSPIQKPAVFLNTFLSLGKVQFLLVLLLPVLFTPLLSFRSLAGLSIPLLVFFLSQRKEDLTIVNRHVPYLIPFLFAGALHALILLKRRWPGLASVVPCAIALLGIGWGLPPLKSIFPGTRTWVDLIEENAFMVVHRRGPEFPEPTAETMREALRLIPQDASVAVGGSFLLVRLCHRRELYIVPHQPEHTEYILIHDRWSWWPISRRANKNKVIREALADPSYEKIIDRDHILLLRKKRPEQEPTGRRAPQVDGQTDGGRSD